MEPKILCIGKEKIAALTLADIPEDAIVICPNPVPIPKLVPRLLPDTEEYFEPVFRNAIPKNIKKEKGEKDEQHFSNKKSRKSQLCDLYDRRKLF